MSGIQLPNPRQKICNDDFTPTWDFFQFLRAVANQLGLITPQVFSQTHTARAQFQAANYPDGSIFYESDRSVFYVAIAGVWVYESGVCRVAQADLPTDLGTAGDVGFLAYVTDYAHLLRWNGTGWEWAPGELGSDYVSAFVTGPDDTTGWLACNGAAGIVRLKSDGNRAFANLPNTPGSWYRR